jgi:Uma2 family endonuclease
VLHCDPVRQRYSFREYLELEEMSPVKHEFMDGHVWAMAGGTPEHAAIAVNVASILRGQLRGRPCRVFSSDLRIRVLATGLGTYPDVTVVCDALETDPDDPKAHTVTNARLVIEVLSPSTEDYDRGEKLANYKRVPSLQEIVLVAHDTFRLEVWRRRGDTWALDVTSEEGAARLEAVDCMLELSEVYDNPLSR